MPANLFKLRFAVLLRPACGLLAGSLLLGLAGCQTDGRIRHEHKTGERAVSLRSIEWGSDLPTRQEEKEKPRDIWERIRRGYKLQDFAANNPRVEQQRIGFINRSETLEKITERSGPYIHYIVEQLEENDMPLELALLPMIESSYDPLAYSPARAAGLWQFIPETGRLFKLRQNNLYDGRRDITASTGAAIAYLQRLRDLFNGDWLLALAAYNAGEGTVSRAIERNEQKGLPVDYWNLPLPGETRDYVPRLLALSQIIQSPDSYGIDLAPVANEPYFGKVAVPAQLDLNKVAAATSLDEKELMQLNPAFKRRVTMDGTTHLLVPLHKVDEVTSSLAESGVRWLEYKVVSGDSLPGIANRFHVTSNALRELNNLEDDGVQVGQMLRIPQLTVTPDSPLYARLQVEAEQDDDDDRKVSSKVHTVRASDNLASIAQRYKVSVKDLQRWNKLKGNKLRAGQKLTIQIADKGKDKAKEKEKEKDKAKGRDTRDSKAVAAAAGKDGKDGKDGKTVAASKDSKDSKDGKAVTAAAAKDSKAASKTTAPAASTYKVRAGDTLSSVARRFSVSVSDLKSWNPGIKESLKLNQPISIRNKR